MKGVTLPTVVPGQSAQLYPMTMVKTVVGTAALVALAMFGIALGKWAHGKTSGYVGKATGTAQGAFADLFGPEVS